MSSVAGDRGGAGGKQHLLLWSSVVGDRGGAGGKQHLLLCVV